MVGKLAGVGTMREWLAVLGWWIAAGTLVAQPPAGAGVGGELPRYWLERVRVFDGERLLGERDVLIEGGKIAAMGEGLEAPEGVEAISGMGRTLIPGMIDAHTHAFTPVVLQQAIFFGVTTECDMMSVPRMAGWIRQQQREKRPLDQAEFFSAGAAVTVAKGHGTQFGFVVPVLERAEQAAEFVAARVEEGSDYIKIIYDDGKALGVSFAMLDREMLERSIEAAHAQERLAVAHVGSQAGAKDVVACGGDGLVHGFAESVIEETLLEAMVAGSVFVVPTATVVANACGENQAGLLLEDPGMARLMTEGEKTALQAKFPQRSGNVSRWELLRENIGRMHRAGVVILAGTDAPNPGTLHGASLHQELELLTEAGLTPSEALASATSKAARAFGWKDRGTIEVGKRADVVLVEGNPTEQIRDTRRIVRVWKDGVVVDRETRLKQLGVVTDGGEAPAR